MNRTESHQKLTHSGKLSAEPGVSDVKDPKEEYNLVSLYSIMISSLITSFLFLLLCSGTAADAIDGDKTLLRGDVSHRFLAPPNQECVAEGGNCNNSKQCCNNLDCNNKCCGSCPATTTTPPTTTTTTPTTTTSAATTTTTTTSNQCGDGNVQTQETCDSGCGASDTTLSCAGSCTETDPASGASCFYYLGCSSDCAACVQPPNQGDDVDLTINTLEWKSFPKERGQTHPEDCSTRSGATSGQYCQINYQTQNLGTDDVWGRIECRTFYTRYFLIPDDGGNDILLKGGLANNKYSGGEIKNLSNSQVRIVAWDDSEIPAGSYHLRVCIDVHNEHEANQNGFIAETNEGNNCLEIPIEVSA